MIELAAGQDLTSLFVDQGEITEQKEKKKGMREAARRNICILTGSSL